MVSFLIEEEGILNINPQDCWGMTPYDEANREKNIEILLYLEIKGGKSGIDLN